MKGRMFLFIVAFLLLGYLEESLYDPPWLKLILFHM